MNVKLCIKITLEVWFVDRQAMKETCISLYVKICVCDFIDSRKEKQSQDPRSVVRSFGILHQAVRWHSLHARNSNFVLSNLCGERTECRIAGSCFAYPALQAERGPAAPLTGPQTG